MATIISLVSRDPTLLVVLAVLFVFSASLSQSLCSLVPFIFSRNSVVEDKPTKKRALCIRSNGVCRSILLFGLVSSFSCSHFSLHPTRLHSCHCSLHLSLLRCALIYPIFVRSFLPFTPFLFVFGNAPLLAALLEWTTTRYDANHHYHRRVALVG
jgi:hypothetical protein